MKNQLIATAAAFALATAAGAAQAQTVGYVGAAYGHTEVDVLGLEGDGDTYGVEGAVRFDAGQLGAQIDGQIARTEVEGDDATSVGATAHLNAKFDGGLIGGFAGVQDSDDTTLWAVGAEAQANLSPAATLYGQLGYGQIDDVDADFWAARAELRFFVSENFRLQGAAGYTKVDADIVELDAWNLGVEAEYQFAGTNWSVLGGYDRTEADDLDLSADTFRLGVRYSFGGTLRDRDQAGASLGSVSKLFAAGAAF